MERRMREMKKRDREREGGREYGELL